MDVTALLGPQDSRKEEALHAFVQTIEELLTCLQDTFPECPKVKHKLGQFKILVKPPDCPSILRPGAVALMTRWHRDLSPFYAHCAQDDAAAVLNSHSPIVQELDIARKWHDPTFDAESRKNLMLYIKTLNSLCSVYFGGTEIIPSTPPPTDVSASTTGLFDFFEGDNKTGTLMSRVKEEAHRLAEQVASGQANFASIDIIGLGRSIAEHATVEDLEQFTMEAELVSPQMEQVLNQMNPADLPPGMPNPQMFKIMMNMLKGSGGGGGGGGAKK